MVCKRKSEKMALLVGGNPLPNFLAVQILQPREVVLLYSDETQHPMERLKDVLENVSAKIEKIDKKHIADATDAQKIRDSCQGLDVCHLHYSGGTKTMAAHARQAIKLKDKQASYLDERKGLLRFDDGYDIALSGEKLGLTLDILLKLHGIDRKKPTKRGVEIKPTPSPEDVKTLAEKILKKPELAGWIYKKLRSNGKRKNLTQAKKEPWLPNDKGLSLSVSRVPEQNWNKATYEKWDDFLCGGWLEEWTAEKIRTCIQASGEAVDVGVRCQRRFSPKVEFEIDVALMRGHRLHVVSCTTARKKPICKSKLFEVAMRARQMGGDLARSALVCLLHGGDGGGSYVDQLRSDIKSLWDAPNVPGVFGLDDLREWHGAYGDPNLESLRQWLES